MAVNYCQDAARLQADQTCRDRLESVVVGKSPLNRDTGYPGGVRF
jgi:hypothetical protein